MPEPLFNSRIQKWLVSANRLVAARLDLHRGLLGFLYRNAYFFYKRATDRDMVAGARQLIKPGTLVIDVGANIGFFTHEVARRCGATVLAFEPDPSNHRDLEATMNAAGLADRVRAYQVALSDHTGTAQLFLSDLAPTDHKLIDSRSSRSIPVTTFRLDDFFSRHPKLASTPVSLIKIDVQGAELNVLRGMTETLRTHGFPPILVEYSPADLAQAGVSSQVFFDTFLALGYEPHMLPTLTACKPHSLIEQPNRAYMDLMMMRAPQSMPATTARNTRAVAKT